jgi:hypothetical protein
VLFEGDRMARLLSETAEGGAAALSDLDPDLAQDLRFQAEVVQYRKLLRALRSLRDDVVDPDADLEEDVLLTVDEDGEEGEEGERGVLRTLIGSRRAAYVGGALAAASLGGALVIVRRRRAA